MVGVITAVEVIIMVGGEAEVTTTDGGTIAGGDERPFSSGSTAPPWRFVRDGCRARTSARRLKRAQP